MEKEAFPEKFTPPETNRKWDFRIRSLGNLLRMGHCAPAIMKTLLDIHHPEKEGPVRLSAGLPGGIGNTGFECGGITSPLILLGLRSGLRDERNGLPLIFHQGHNLFQTFLERNGSSRCLDIQGENHRLHNCIKAVCMSPEITWRAGREGSDAIHGELLEAYALLYSHLSIRGFHCARSVLEQLDPVAPPDPAAREAASGFMGGTVFKGMTCGALVAGVMALGSGLPGIENSLPRVLRMIVLMKTGGNAFADHINSFNVVMNRGQNLANWFSEEFGSTQCRAITGCDFSLISDVRKYIDAGLADKCVDISEKVAERVRGMMQFTLPDPSSGTE